MNNKNLVKTSLSIISFIILFILTILWFFLIHWKIPQYQIAIITFLNGGLSGFNWILGRIFYIVAFFPLTISLIIITLGFIFFKRQNKVLKLCLSLSLVFIISLTTLPILINKSILYMSKFTSYNWINIPKLRYESVNNLLSTHKLIGMTSSEIFNLLGTQDYETTSYDSKTYFWDLDNPLNINNSYLTISISKDKVISYKIISDSATN
ncbi:MAG: hypothetical protein ACRC41_10095 [Sarcina sp.]